MELILDYIFTVQFAIFAAIVIFAKLGLKFVPQNRAYVIERFGKYNRTIDRKSCFSYRFQKRRRRRLSAGE